MNKEINKKPEITIIEPKKIVRINNKDADFFDSYEKIKINTIAFWCIFNTDPELRSSISEGFRRVEKKYDVDKKEGIIDINIDGYEEVEQQILYTSSKRMLETHRICFRDPLTNKYLRNPDGQTTAIERYNYKMRMPSYLTDEDREVYIIPIFDKKGLSGELLRITKTRK
jgi:hypothetical protein